MFYIDVCFWTDVLRMCTFDHVSATFPALSAQLQNYWAAVLASVLARMFLLSK